MVLLLPGGDGITGLQSGGGVRQLGRNFVVRNARSLGRARVCDGVAGRAQRNLSDRSTTLTKTRPEIAIGVGRLRRISIMR
jgi:hypothetical protein